LSSLARRSGDVFQEIATIERLYQESNRAIPQCLLANVVVVMGRNENDRQLTPFPSNPPLEFRPIYAGQTHVCDHARHVRQRSGQQKRFRGIESDAFVPGGFEHALNGFSNATIVVDRCDDRMRRRHQATPFCIRGIVRTAHTPG
jgi:hypothetical protein